MDSQNFYCFRGGLDEWSGYGQDCTPWPYCKKWKEGMDGDIVIDHHHEEKAAVTT